MEKYIESVNIRWADIDANLLGIEQADFVEAIGADRDPEVTGEQGLRSLALIMGFSMARSIRTITSAAEAIKRAAQMVVVLCTIPGAQLRHPARADRGPATSIGDERRQRKTCRIPSIDADPAG